MKQRNHRTPPAQRGITLLELMVTISIVSILMVMASVSFSGFFDKRRLAQAAEMLHSDLQWARMAAMQFNANTTITFSGEGTASWGYVISGAVSKSVTGSTHITLTDSDTVGFYPQGTSNNGTIRLSAGGYEMRVIVSSRGRVRICSVGGAVVDYLSC